LAARVALGAGLAWAVAAGAVVVLAAPWIAGWFVDTGSEAFSMTLAMLHVVAAFQIADALQAVAAGVLRGVGDTISAMRWALVAYVGVAPVAAAVLASGLDRGALGIWLGLALGLCIAAVALVPRALRRTSSKR
ncbi:MAG: MATE family efflux transporter, partial [Sandaracinaceae bacterium]